MNNIPCDSANNKDDESSQYGFLQKAFSAHGNCKKITSSSSFVLLDLNRN